MLDKEEEDRIWLFPPVTHAGGVHYMLTRNLQDEAQQLSLTKNGRILLKVQRDSWG